MIFELMLLKPSMVVAGKEQARQAPVAEVAVVGVTSGKWGETPVGYVTLKPGVQADAEDIRAFANARVGKTQRLSDLIVLDVLPRSHIGKVLKKELRDEYRGPARTVAA